MKLCSELIRFAVMGLVIGLFAFAAMAGTEYISRMQQKDIIEKQRETIESCIQDLKYAEEGLQDAAKGICIAGEISEVWANLANQCCKKETISLSRDRIYRRKVRGK